MEVPTSLSAERFARLVSREHEQVELKTGMGRRPIAETMVAFSNASGGVIFIGVRDDRTVVGRGRDQGLDDAIHAAARDSHDVGRYEIREVAVDGRSVVAVIVAPRQEGFAQTSDGRTLVRSGGHNVALFGVALHDFLADRRRRWFEDSDSGVPADQLDQSALERLARAHGWRTRREIDHRLGERGLLTGNGTLTVAGALLLTDPTETLRSDKYVVDVRGYESDVDTGYVRRELVAGPIDQQIAHSVELVLRDLGSDMVVTGATRSDLPRLPPAAVREVISNAVAHRNYELDRSAVVVEVRPGALVVTSPGSLPEPVTIATMREAQAPRNPHVIDVLRKLGLAEDSGRGIDLIEDSLRDDFLPEPVFADSSAMLRAELPTGRLITVEERAWLEHYRRTDDLDAEELLVLVQLARRHTASNAEVRRFLQVDSTQARAVLRRLRERGLISQRGERGGASYHLAALAPAPSDEAILLRLAADRPLTNTVVRQALGVDSSQALGLLRRMVNEGLIVREGTKRGSSYRLP